ncbi:DUF4037 domain-containing protein [Clostridium sp. ZS2-4]|uniref:DUF4037 domain-containing protein n=1 Tax=Clostridium sp. ZS2-4 TaxID=2987703 RepID=UPI00227BC6EE|nr:DUF4037 domain-containing protein [Clostridium sp. ZS2-4]MCY6354616.1 DUF4037 domain-containing protein [Clostridium sp. ZS2-4]
MIKENEIIHEIVSKFKNFKQVEGITLAGSVAFKTEDENSDIDIDVYINNELPPSEREKIAREFSDCIEIDNQFWGTGDEWKLRNSVKDIDIIYLDMQWIKDYLERVIDRCDAVVGYSTCFWHNVINSRIIYDKNGELSKLQERYTVPYPNKLKENIIAKNYPVLRNNMSAYYYQIEKAIKRKDLISINHRTAALLASYFDIIFAINGMPHPGEKKLLKIITNNCKKVPFNMHKNVLTLLNSCTSCDNNILLHINQLIDNLDELLIKENINF